MLFRIILDALVLCALTLECFRILQACSYKPQRGYFKIFASSYFLMLVATEFVGVVCHFLLAKWSHSIVFAVAVCLSLFKKRKTPLKFTKRIARMLIVNTLVLFCLCYFAKSIYLVIFLPIVALISWCVCLPIDNVIANIYLKRAVNKLRKSNLTIVAITGSYGKTCTKDMLAALLQDSIAPTGSCNTPLGIASFVNKTDFTPYKYLILEFGARNVGDIAQLCKLFPPQCGIVTGICEQHLATFKNLDGILRAKGELVEHIPTDGFCILNASDCNLKKLASTGSCYKFFTSKNFVCHVNHSLEGTSFDVVHNGKTYPVQLPQISNYIVDTFLMCFEMCIALGQSSKITTENCKKVSQTPHRMQVTYNGRFYVVDDAYNANITGVYNCCKTLSQFNNYKIVLTQGIVEGGAKQQQLNEQCGKLLGENFDVVIVIGKYSKQIANGAKDLTNIVVVKNLNQAMHLLQQYVRPNCIVLFQNDLPDVVSL